MSNTPNTKKYPATTDEVAALLGLKSTGHGLPMGTINSEHENSTDKLEANNHGVHANTNSEAHVVDTHNDSHGETLESEKSNNSAILNTVKTVMPFVAIFSVGLFLYYFFFTGVNFNSLFKNVQTKTQSISVVSKETVLEELQKQDLTGYNKWISGFYYDVSDKSILDPNADNSGNGLTNFQKYLLNLNPKSYDTLGLGIPDSQAITQGINPLSGANLTQEQKDIIEKYFDMEVVMNRLTLANLQNPGRVAGLNTQNNTSNNIVNTSSQTGLRGLPETGKVKGLDTQFVSPKTGADISEVDMSVDIDYSIVGHLDIPSLNVAVPIVWSQDVKTFEKDLQTGVIHYPKTALPGQIGTTYIAGHSSNFVWSKGDYNQVFRRLNELKDNASFSVSVTDKTGKVITYHYVVTSKKEFLPTDPAQITNTGKSLVALSTCWPLNSTAKRLVVFGQLTQVVK
jgi:LPXTG-site transpeptidase (sortase) family protein